MEQIPIIGSEGKPILYAYLGEGNLHFQYEYYGTGENEMDYEFIHSVELAEYPAIAIKFGLDPKTEILAIVQQITDTGRGEELHMALLDKDIKSKLFTWMS